jgi:hypothetical protein
LTAKFKDDAAAEACASAYGSVEALTRNVFPRTYVLG